MKITRRQLKKIISESLADNQLLLEGVSAEDLADIFEKIIMKRPDGTWTKHWSDFARDSKEKTMIGAAHFTGSGLDRLYVAMDNAGVIGKYFVDYGTESVEDPATGDVQSEERPDADRRYTLEDLRAYTKSVRSGFEGGDNRNETIFKSSGSDSSTHLPKIAAKLDNADWWVRGMYRFLSSSDSEPVQREAIKAKFRGILRQSWVTSEFHVAVCMAIKNSSGGELKHALRLTQGVSDPDKRASRMMDWYCGLHPTDNVKNKEEYRDWRTRCSAVKKFYGWDPGRETSGGLSKGDIKKRGDKRSAINEMKERKMKISRKTLHKIIRENLLTEDDRNGDGRIDRSEIGMSRDEYDRRRKEIDQLDRFKQQDALDALDKEARDMRTRDIETMRKQDQQDRDEAPLREKKMPKITWYWQHPADMRRDDLDPRVWRSPMSVQLPEDDSYEYRVGDPELHWRKRDKSWWAKPASSEEWHKMDPNIDQKHLLDSPNVCDAIAKLDKAFPQERRQIPTISISKSQMYKNPEASITGKFKVYGDDEQTAYIDYNEDRQWSSENLQKWLDGWREGSIDVEEFEGIVRSVEDDFCHDLEKEMKWKFVAHVANRLDGTPGFGKPLTNKERTTGITPHDVFDRTSAEGQTSSSRNFDDTVDSVSKAAREDS